MPSPRLRVSPHANIKVFSIGSQSLMDVDARVRDLDKAVVDLQVIYPTEHSQHKEGRARRRRGAEAETGRGGAGGLERTLT